MTGAFPGLQICAQIAPPMGFDPQSAAADDLIDRLIETKAQVCFLALGAPKQEIFAARAQSRAPGIGFISIGAGLDFIAGTQTRAPRWVRAIAAEWLWRLVHDPRRLAMRYAACFAILPGLTLAALRARAQPSAKGSTPV
jgi:exopolysaccharide biosynthesis WecB/TagA/CpsF family protein